MISLIHNFFNLLIVIISIFSHITLSFSHLFITTNDETHCGSSLIQTQQHSIFFLELFHITLFFHDFSNT
jgi:hypothetical protein